MWPAARNTSVCSPQSVARSPQSECGPQPTARNLSVARNPQPAICDPQPAARNAICGPQPAARNPQFSNPRFLFFFIYLFIFLFCFVLFFAVGFFFVLFVCFVYSLLNLAGWPSNNKILWAWKFELLQSTSMQ